jgi:hypothetical protein
MSLAFSRRRSHRKRGGAINISVHDNYNNLNERLHASPEQIANAVELMNLQREYLASFNIKHEPNNINVFDPHQNSYVKYKEKYGRDPMQDAALYSFNVQPKLHSSKIRNLSVAKATSRRKTLQPNPIKRLFRRNRQTRRKAARRL